jgi:DNA-binding IclR family transcriptional regulator
MPAKNTTTIDAKNAIASGGKNTTASDAKNQIQTYRKMMDVLRSFSRVDRQLPLASIAASANLPRATAHRILTALREVGFIEQDSRRGTYSLGIGLFELGSLALANMDLLREGKPFLDQLAQTSGTAAHLGVFNGMEMVVVEREDQPDRPMRAIRPVEAAPAYCTGLGKAVLAFQDKTVVDRVIAAGLKRFTRNTICSAVTLRQELARTRQRRYAIDNGEHQLWVRCVAAPIRDSYGHVFAALSVTGPADQITEDRTPLLAELVTQAADSISRHLGYAPA